MSRARNAKDFLQAYRQIRRGYNELFRPLIESVRADYANGPTGNVPVSVDEALEAHVREYFVNAFLRALNWRLDRDVEDGLPNLIPEAPVASAITGRTKFLDYLGTESGSTDPLLIVETKRPSSLLPKRREFTGRSDTLLTADEPASSVIAAGLLGATLTGEWDEWLRTLRVYVTSVHAQRGAAPRRVVMTSGRWLIIFIDPDNSFLASGGADPSKILVFEIEERDAGRRDLIEEYYNYIFGWLEHQRVLDKAPPLAPGELAFYVRPEQLNSAVHGLRLMYIEEPGFLSASPVIKVMPIIFLRSNHGAWLRVDSGREVAIPHSREELAGHLENVRQTAARLLEDVNARMSTHFAATTVESHYANAEDFKTLRGVVEIQNSDRYTEHVLVTGQHGHYFRPEPTVPACPYHHWGDSNREGCAQPRLVSIQTRSTDPRSFFISGEDHHCSHRDVAAAKSSPITADNQDRCGPRSGKEHDPFCEIWPFEKHLCCRTCIFEDVCTSAPVFTLPCRRLPAGE